MMDTTKVRMVLEGDEPFLYPNYAFLATERFVDSKPFLTKHQSKGQAISHILEGCMSTPRVEVYILDESGEVKGHSILCPGDDLHYGNVVDVRSIYSPTPAITRKLWKAGKKVAKATDTPYLAYTKWKDDGSYTHHFLEVK